MKQTLIAAIALLGLATTAFAQVPDNATSPGLHDPNPPMATPDLRLPPPCAPTANLAAATTAAKPDPSQVAVVRTGRLATAGGGDAMQCSANIPQSATLPSSAPLAQ